MAEVKIFYTPMELKKILRVDYNTVLNRLNTGVWKGVKIGNRWRILDEEVEKIKNGFYNNKESIQKVELYHTAEELAEFLKVCNMTILRKLKLGSINGVKIGNRWRISSDEFNKIKGGLEIEQTKSN